MTEINNIKVTIEEQNLIKNNGVDKLPLNPTSQGFSGQSVRKQLAQAVTGARGSVLALMIEKFAIIEDFSNTVLLVEVRLVGDDLTFIYADGREFKFPLDVITGGLEQDIITTNERIDGLLDDMNLAVKIDYDTITRTDNDELQVSNEVINDINSRTKNNDFVAYQQLARDYLDANIYTIQEIDAKLSATYKPKGTITGIELLAITPTSDNEGFVYNISTEFTTTNDFIEGAGITHRAGENVVIVEITEGVYKFDVLSGFVDLSNYVEKDDNEILTTENITINTDVGGLPSGTTINTGTSITDLIKLLGIKTYYPTFIAPSLTLAIDVNNSVEAGYTSDATLTATFNRGEIKGDLVEGVWNANTKQNDRAGEGFLIDSDDTEGANTKTLTDNVVEEGANVYNAEVYYLTGPQPLDSDGNNYETPLAAGTILASKTIYGYRKLFYGLSSQATNSAEVRALSNSLLNPANGTTFTINITSGASKVVFAYPATLQDVTEVIYKEGLNADIKGIFTKTTVSVEGANGYTAIDYKVYTYTPINPFDSPVTYEVKI